jgi:hypothetical protein
MYTVQELIEALEKCPKDYPIFIHGDDFFCSEITAVGIDNNEGTVDIFTE